MLIVEQGNPRDPRASALLGESHALMQSLYPPEENYALDIEELCQPGIHFLIARQGDALLGTGALALKPDYAEIKSMFTTQSARGKGVAAALIRALEDEARTRALPALKLETGEELVAAVRLYERHGFTRCGPFGDYRENAYSVFMEKPLTP